MSEKSSESTISEFVATSLRESPEAVMLRLVSELRDPQMFVMEYAKLLQLNSEIADAILMERAEHSLKVSDVIHSIMNAATRLENLINMLRSYALALRDQNAADYADVDSQKRASDWLSDDPEEFIHRLVGNLVMRNHYIQGVMEVLLATPQISSIEFRGHSGNTTQVKQLLEGVFRATEIIKKDLSVAGAYENALRDKGHQRNSGDQTSNNSLLP